MKTYKFLVEIPQYTQCNIEAENERELLIKLTEEFKNNENVQYVECDENWNTTSEWVVL